MLSTANLAQVAKSEKQRAMVGVCALPMCFRRIVLAVRRALLLRKVGILVSAFDAPGQVNNADCRLG